MILSKFEPEKHVKDSEVNEFLDYLEQFVIFSAPDSLTIHENPIQTVLTGESHLNKVLLLLLVVVQPVERTSDYPSSEVRGAEYQ